jgi:glycoside/pentoside/hexuronide:cation symporter, GPH family
MTDHQQPGTTTALSLREKISYGVSDAGFNFYSMGISTFLMIFYTDVFGITAAAAGSVLSLTKMFSMATTPVIGAMADRTKTRYGKFRPYMAWVSIPLAVAMVMTFTTPNLDEGGKLAYAYATYFFMLVCYTSMNIPYNALSGVMTSVPQERTSINSLRFICAFSGSTLLTATTPFLVKWLGQGDERLGWQLTMVVWGIAATALFLVTFFNTRERVAPLQEKNSNVLQDLTDLSKNLPWILLFMLALFTMVTATLRNGSAAYYFKYYVERPDLITAFIPAYMAAAAVGAALAPFLTRYFDRRLVLMCLMAATAVLSSAFFFVPKDQVALMFALQIGVGLVLGPKAPLTFAMYADTADYNEWRTGRRATAMTFAAATFSGKLAIALASAIMGVVLTMAGYAANVAQTETSQAGIVLLISFMPAIFAFLAFLAVVFYKLDDRTMLQVRTELAERAAAKKTESE